MGTKVPQWGAEWSHKKLHMKTDMFLSLLSSSDTCTAIEKYVALKIGWGQSSGGQQHRIKSIFSIFNC